MKRKKETKYSILDLSSKHSNPHVQTINSQNPDIRSIVCSKIVKTIE